MGIQQLAKQFVDLCNQGKNFEVMRTMYAPDVVSVEADGRETAGQQAVIRKSELWGGPDGANAVHGEVAKGPYFNGPDQFAVHFAFDVTNKASGQRRTLEEVGVYTVRGDKVTREQFFYEGER